MLKTYNKDSLGYRISCGKLVNKLIKSVNKKQIIAQSKLRYTGKLKHTIISILGMAYKKTNNDFYLTEIMSEMKLFILSYLKPQCKVPFYIPTHEIEHVSLIGVFDGINKYDKKKGFMYHSIINGIKRELSRLGYEERKHDVVSNDIAICEQSLDLNYEKGMVKNEFFIALHETLKPDDYDEVYDFINFDGKIKKERQNKIKMILQRNTKELSWLTA